MGEPTPPCNRDQDIPTRKKTRVLLRLGHLGSYRLGPSDPTHGLCVGIFSRG